MTKRSTVNSGAFDALLKQTGPQAKPKAPAARKKAEPKARRKASAGGKKKATAKTDQAGGPAFPVPTGQPETARPPTPAARVTLTLRFDPDLLDRARNACHATGKSFQQMIDFALWNMTHALEGWNGGKPYPARPGTLKPGPKPRKAGGK